MTKITSIARTALARTTLVKVTLIGLAAASLAGGSLGASAMAQDAAPAIKPVKPARQCFSLSDWHGWTAPDRDTLYMKVRNRDVYRVDLAYSAYGLTSPGVHLVSIIRGSDSVCQPLDLDLRVSDGIGMAIPIRAKTITKLTPEEIAAIPKKYKP